MQGFKIVLLLLFCTPISAQKQANIVVYFDKNSNLLTIEARKTLSNWATEYVKTKRISVHLKGHSDKDGDEKENLLLSKKRVVQVQSFLKKKGIDAKIDFLGEIQPINNNENESQKTLNRRVEILLIDESISSFFQNLQLDTLDMASKTQFFEGNAQDTLHFKGKNGTRILFLPNSLINSELEKVTGAFQIELREFYAKSSMIWNRLSTYTLDSQLLVSKGMINLLAFQNKQPLELASDATVYIDFPKREINDHALLWEGIDTNGTIVWKKIPKAIPPQTPLDSMTVINKLIELHSGKDLIKKGIADKNIRIEMEKKRYKDSTFVYAVPKKELRLDPFFLGRITRDTSFGTIVPNSSLSKDAFQSALVNLAFASTKLGLINCDYFYRKNKKDLINWQIPAEKNTNIAVIFPTENVVIFGVSLLDSAEATFYNLPKGEQVELLAFSLNDKTNTYFFQKQKVIVGQKISLNLEETTFNRIEKEINLH